MSQVKLDTKDKRILDALDRNPKITIPQLARKVAISRQVAEYRINKLVEQKSIYSFYTLINLGKLGYSCFRAHVKLKNISEEVCSKFAKKLFTEYPTMWVAFISGSFDLIIDIFAKNIFEFEKLFSRIIEENGEVIKDYQVLVITELSLYNYGYFTDEKDVRNKIVLYSKTEEKEIDEKDKKILDTIKNSARESYEAIGRKINLTRNGVKSRVIKLQEKGIIAGYKPIINFSHFGKQSFKIFIKYNNSKINQEKKLLEHLKAKEGILATLKLFGKWNLDIEIHVKDIKELQQFIIGLRNKYEIIEDYEIIQIIEDYGINFYPKSLS